MDGYFVFLFDEPLDDLRCLGAVTGWGERGVRVPEDSKRLGRGRSARSGKLATPQRSNISASRSGSSTGVFLIMTSIRHRSLLRRSQGIKRNEGRSPCVFDLPSNLHRYCYRLHYLNLWLEEVLDVADLWQIAVNTECRTERDETSIECEVIGTIQTKTAYRAHEVRR